MLLWVMDTSFNLVSSHNRLSTEANSTRVSKEKILVSKYPKNWFWIWFLGLKKRFQDKRSVRRDSKGESKTVSLVTRIFWIVGFGSCLWAQNKCFWGQWKILSFLRNEMQTNCLKWEKSILKWGKYF